jgi:aminopeptidase N
MKEYNIGINLYFKPAYALMILRNNIVGPKRFDFAFRKYIQDWAFRHPTPWDFFRSMENSTGEDLAWFWKGMILENYQLDQAVVGVEKTGKDGNSVLVTVKNQQKMAMPVIVELTTMSGKQIRKSLPVEIWQSSDTHTFRVATSETIRKVVLDPDRVFPDIQPQNNTWQGSK